MPIDSRTRLSGTGLVGPSTVSRCSARLSTPPSDVAGTILAPLPPKVEPQAPAPTVVADAPAQAPAVSGPSCLRYAGGSWSAAGSMDLNACVQTLFAGQCEKRGGATYGRWGDQTLRLVKDRVEISSDNRRFRTLAEQGPNCSIPPVG